MATRTEIETFISEATAQLDRFQNADPALLQASILDEFIDAGFALLEHYQQTGDAHVDDEIIGAYVDCAMIMHALAADDGLDDATRQQAEAYMTGLEDMVNAITAAVEQNIAAGR